MGCGILVAPVAALLLLLLLVSWAIMSRRKGSPSEMLGRMPPGPRTWPMVGNIFQLGRLPHHSFTKLAGKHGPIMTLWLGSMCTVVISSNDAAREMFKNHDVVLAGRKILEVMKGDIGNEGSLITAQYGPRWRILRRLCTTEFFVTSKLDATVGVRARCIDQMVKYIEEAGGSGTRAVDVGRLFYLMTFNLIGYLMFSKDILDPISETGAEFFFHGRKVMELVGHPNIADFLPILKWFDPQRLRKRTQFHLKKAFDIVGLYLKERIDSWDDFGDEERRRRDYLDVLLGYRSDNTEGPLVFSSTTINVNLLEMFIAGTDTSTSTLEWAMVELLRCPQTLKKVQAELRSVVNPGSKLEEKDLDNLPYLKAVVKETLRLHPPVPFLVPHFAMDSCNMLGYHIPKDTQILVNVWAIGRDPKLWKDPLEFNPERFLEPNMVDFKGQHFEFIPFGSGRRMCPAVPLVSRVLPLALGSILHLFDWHLADGIKPAELDMGERLGIALRKAIPLKAVPVPHNV